MRRCPGSVRGRSSWPRLAASCLLRRRSAALRHWVLATGSLRRAMLIGFIAVVPAWQLAVLRAPRRRQIRRSFRESRRRQHAVAAAATSAGGVDAATRSRGWVLADGAAWLAGRAAGGRAAAACAACAPASARRITHGRWRDRRRADRARLRLRRPVRLLQSSSPIAARDVGARRPTIILPAARRPGPTSAPRVVCCARARARPPRRLDRRSCRPSCCGRSTGSTRWPGLACRRLAWRASTPATTRSCAAASPAPTTPRDRRSSWRSRAESRGHVVPGAADGSSIQPRKESSCHVERPSRSRFHFARHPRGDLPAAVRGNGDRGCRASSFVTYTGHVRRRTSAAAYQLSRSSSSTKRDRRNMR